MEMAKRPNCLGIGTAEDTDDSKMDRISRTRRKFWRTSVGLAKELNIYRKVQ